MQLIASYYSHQLWTSVWNRLMKLLIIPPLLCSHLNGLITNPNLSWRFPETLREHELMGAWSALFLWFHPVIANYGVHKGLLPLSTAICHGIAPKIYFFYKKKKEKITWQWKVLRAISFPGQRDCYCVSGIFAREGRPHVEWGSEQPLGSYMYMLLSFCNLGEELTRIKKSHRS